MKKSKTAPYLIPLILLLTVVPLIVRLHSFQTNLAQFDWYMTDNQGQDFFLYYKSVAITVIAAVMCLLLAYRYKVRQKDFKFSYQFLPIVAYAALTFISSIFSEYRYFSFHGVSQIFETVWVLLGYCVIAFYAYQFVNTIEDVDAIMFWLTIGLAVMLVIGILQAVGCDLFGTNFGKMLITGWTQDLDRVDLVFEEGRVYMTLYNPNFVASYFALMIPVEIALFVKNKKLVARVAYALLLVASLVCLLASGNRSGIVAFAVTIALTVAMLFKYIVKAWKIVVPGVAAAAIIVGVFVSQNNLIVEKFARLFDAPDQAEDSISEIVTGEEDVKVTYLGQVFHVAYQSDENDNVSIRLVDDEEQPIANTLDEATSTYIVSDERYPSLVLVLVKIGDMIGIDVKVDGRDWYFSKGEDGSYYYVNVYGRLDKINNAPRVAVNFLEKKFEERGTIWSKTIPMLKDSVIFGSGADTYTVTYPQDDYVDKVYDGTTTAIDQKPHCFYLQVATQSGIPALLAILAFYMWYFISGFKIYRKADYQDGLEIIGAGLFLATFTYMVISFLNDSTVAVAPIYWIMMGMGIAINEILKRKSAAGEPEIAGAKQKQKGRK